MKVPSSVSKVLTNKYVLYFVLFLAVTNVLGYMVMGKFTATLFFIIVAYLISNFSENMIVILGSALLLTNILMIGNTVKEGMTSGDNTTSAVKKTEVKKTVKTKEAKAAIVTPGSEEETTNSTLHSAVASHNASKEEEEETTEPAPTTTSDEGMNVMSNKRRNRIDYATTIEDAYGDLNKILGSDGIKRLTEDTQRLMTQQLQLADAMKSMTPLLDNAKSMLQGFDLKNLDGLADLAKSFSASK